jgi:ubiquinone/menaquinone biosynthesis C-methylase UbiE
MKQFVKRRFPIAARPIRWMYGCLNTYRSRPQYIAARAPFLLPYSFNLVFFDNRGNHPTQHLARTKRFARIEDADILVLGCRYGSEVGLWLKERPHRVVALDYFPASGNWQPIQNRYTAGTLEFLVADARRLPFCDDSFDIISSEALLEHVNQVDLCIDEIYRVVKPGGLVYAIFGPLFYTRGGAHYEGDYEHLILPRQQFKNFIVFRQRPVEQQECLFYLDNNMFSYWTMDQYLDAFKAFDTLFSIVFLSPEAYQYRYAHQSEWEQLKTKMPEKDLLVSGLAIWLRKPAR